MNKKNIIFSAIIVFLMLVSTPMISYTTKSTTCPPVVTIVGDDIECTSTPIEQYEDEYFRCELTNAEESTVFVDVIWYYEGDWHYTQEDMEIPPLSQNYTDEVLINWKGDLFEQDEVKVEIWWGAYLLDSAVKNFVASWWTIFYFNSYDTELWTTNYSYMVDGGSTNYASTSTVGDIETLDGNNCTGSETGNITSVWLRTKGYYSGIKRTILLRPIFNGELPGDNYEFDEISTSSEWSQLFEITEDHGAPETWTWNDVANLDCDVIADNSAESRFTLYCSQVEILVCYIDK